MTLRADHVAGAAFAAFGALIIALSGDLPFGQLSMPGSGFLPKIVAVLMVLFGLALIVRARESEPYSTISWADGKHAAMVTVITSLAIGFYTVLGFIITMVLTMVALLVIIERRNPLYAGGYAIAIVLMTYAAFEYLLKTPMPESPFSY
ncbi:MAG: tripartite tricarboxylate transporter TctB family protein [Pseudolabrys sp.]